MSTFVREDPKRGTSTIRHTWRAEVFSEFGDDPELKCHRAEATFDSESDDLIATKKDRILTRKLSELPDGQRQTVLAFFSLMDTLEAEDLAKEQEQAHEN